MGRAAKLKLSRSKSAAKTEWGDLQTPFATLASLGIDQVGSTLAGCDCGDRVAVLQEMHPHLGAQAGVVLVRGYSDLPISDGKECWNSLYQGHCWLVEPESGNIVDPSLDSFEEGSPAMAYWSFRPVRPPHAMQARVVTPSTAADCERILGSAIYKLPAWGPFIDADLLYVPGFLDGRYLRKSADINGMWHLVTALSRGGRSFSMAQVDEQLSSFPDHMLQKLGFRYKTKEEEGNTVGFLVTNP